MEIYIEYAIRVRHLQASIMNAVSKYHFEFIVYKDDVLKFIDNELNSKYTDSDIESIKNYIHMNDIYYLKEINDLDLLNDLYAFIDQSYFIEQYENTKQFIDKYNKKDKK